jgi:curved DNA-binding protein CbpA
MAAADHSGPGPDLCQLLGVPRDSSREEIAQAGRRRARDEHPDARPRDAASPGRFRALAAAWQVLGDPARRAAYDRALPARGNPRHGCRFRGRPGPSPAPRAGSRDEEDARLAGPALRYLARDQGRPW